MYPVGISVQKMSNFCISALKQKDENSMILNERKTDRQRKREKLIEKMHLFWLQV